MNFKLPIELIILGTILILWGIFMLSIHYRDKKRMKEIEKEWEDGRIRQERRDRQWLESEVPTEWIRRSAMVPDEGYMPSATFKTDKLSPPKKMDKHTMR